MIVSPSIQIKPEEVEGIITDYYKKIYNNDAFSIKIEPKKENRRYCNEEVLVTRIKVKRQQKVGNYNIDIEEELEDKDIEEILKNFLSDNLKDACYEIAYMYLDTSIEHVGIYETEEIKFKGINVILKRREKVYKK